MKNYQQCVLRQGDREMTTWIESRGAKLGASVELLPEREWWVVMRVSGHVLPEDVLKTHRQMNRKSLLSVEPMAAPKKNVGQIS